MRSDRGGQAWVRWGRLLAVAAVLGCVDGASLALEELVPPASLKVTPVGMNAIRVEWDDVGGTTVQFYRVERRENLQGPFRTLTRVNRTSGRVILLDTSVEPETFYGYRVVSVDGLGNESTSSVVEGGRTPSRPGIEVRTLSLVPPEISDPDGYVVVIEGPEQARFPIAVNASVRRVPLPVGSYTVRLDGVSAACRPRPGESLTRSVTVTDQGTATVAAVTFAITCRDPTRGEIAVGVSITGDQVPPGTSFTIDVAGIAADASLPESQRVYSRLLTFGASGGLTLLENLRPGQFVLTLGPVPTACLREGSETRRVTTLPLSTDSVLFRLRCGSAAPNTPPVANPNGPYRADVNEPIAFSSAGSTDPDGAIVSYAWDFGDQTSASGASPTKAFAVAGTYTVRLTVTDDRGATASATTTATIGNQPPVAKAGGPYVGVVGTAVAFSGAGSSDPDGTITSYAWTFGDGTTGTGATFSHTYTAAGTFTVSLTVTDNRGATATDQTTATIAPAGSSGGVRWTNTFGTVDQGNQLLPLTLKLDLSEDLPATPGPEALERWIVDNLSWNPAVLRFHSFSFGPGASGSVDVNEAVGQGRLKIFGIQAAGSSTGVLTLGTVRFSIVGAAGARTTTSTTLGVLLGTAATGRFDYLSVVTVDEATFTVGGAPAPTGTVRGTVSRAGGGAIAGATVNVTPGGNTTTNAQGQYTVAGVPVGSGTVRVSGLPSGCTAPADRPYAVASAGQTVAVDFTVTCSAPPSGGTVTGTVTRSTGGAAGGATVTVTPGGTTSADASGRYTVGNVPVGSGTVSVSNLPSGCTAPAPKPYTIATAGETVTVDFSVTCSAPPAVGTVTGTVTRSTGGAIAGATVTVNPGGTGTTNASGQYTVANVPVGSGTVAVSGLPGGCTAPAAKPYTIATAGLTVTVDFAVDCGSSSPNSFRGRWTVSGNTATLEFRLNVTQGTIGSMQVTLNLSSPRLQYTSFGPAATPELGNPQATNPPATTITLGGFTTDPAGRSGDLGVIRLIFTILPGGPTTVTPTLTGFGALRPDFTNITGTFQGNVSVDALTLP